MIPFSITADGLGVRSCSFDPSLGWLSPLRWVVLWEEQKKGQRRGKWERRRLGPGSLRWHSAGLQLHQALLAVGLVPAQQNSTGYGCLFLLTNTPACSLLVPPLLPFCCPLPSALSSLPPSHAFSCHSFSFPASFPLHTHPYALSCPLPLTFSPVYTPVSHSPSAKFLLASREP